MGNGSSIDAAKIIYLDISGKSEKIVFSRHCGSRDIVELLAQAAGVSRYSQILLKNGEGTLVTISPTMPANTPSSPYKLSVKNGPKKTKDPVGDDKDVISTVLTQVAEQFNKSMVRAFKVEEMQTEMTKRITDLEKKIERDGLKVIELERCKKDIADMKDSMYNAQKKMIDYNRLREAGDDNSR